MPTLKPAAKPKSTSPSSDYCEPATEVSVGDNITAKLVLINDSIDSLTQRLVNTADFFIGQEPQGDCNKANELTIAGCGLLRDTLNNLENIHRKLYRLEDQIRRLEAI